MSTKHVRTASDLVRFGCFLKIECIACGAARTMTGLEVAKFHGAMSLEHLRASLRCHRCRLKVAKVTVLPPV